MWTKEAREALAIGLAYTGEGSLEAIRDHFFPDWKKDPCAGMRGEQATAIRARMQELRNEPAPAPLTREEQIVADMDSKRAELSKLGKNLLEGIAIRKAFKLDKDSRFCVRYGGNAHGVNTLISCYTGGYRRVKNTERGERLLLDAAHGVRMQILDVDTQIVTHESDLNTLPADIILLAARKLAKE